MAFLHSDPDLRVPVLVEKTLVLEHQALLVRLPVSPGEGTPWTQFSMKSWFLRLTRMSGFTTWWNSPSTGPSQSGIKQEYSIKAGGNQQILFGLTRNKYDVEEYIYFAFLVV